MECRNCPYGKENPLWCDKVGGNADYLGYCGDFYESADKKDIHYYNHSKNKRSNKRSNKRERDLKHKNKLKLLAENCRYYPPPVIYTDEVWIKGRGFVKNPKPYYKRLYRDNHKNGRYRWYKKYASRCTRRYKGEIHNGTAYKKVYDFWWEVD